MPHAERVRRRVPGQDPGRPLRGRRLAAASSRSSAPAAGDVELAGGPCRSQAGSTVRHAGGLRMADAESGQGREGDPKRPRGHGRPPYKGPPGRLALHGAELAPRSSSRRSGSQDRRRAPAQLASRFEPTIVRVLRPGPSPATSSSIDTSGGTTLGRHLRPRARRSPTLRSSRCRS